MQTFIFFYLMLVPPKPGLPTYLVRFDDPVSCQIELTKRKEEKPAEPLECRRFVSLVDLSKR